MTSEEFNWLRLHQTPGLGGRGMARLLQAFGSVENILAAGPADWTQKAGVRPAVAHALPSADDPELGKLCRKMDQLHVHLLGLDNSAFPPLLRTLPDPPALLYVRGDLPQAQALAVVGSRSASDAGKRFTASLCSELAERGVTIISGLARGIDSAAHEGALNGGGLTVAVLGCGIDRIYPPENASLFLRIIDQGAIVSEYPPGTPPLPGHFPGRNRIISGLCRGTLIVEAARRSGSLITAEFALEQGREVFAVPGPVQSRTGDGVNSLLKDGAHLVTCAQDILDVLCPGAPTRAAVTHHEEFAAGLSSSESQIFSHLGGEPLHIDDLARRCGLTPMEVSVILLHLELRGGIEALPGKRYVRSLAHSK